MKAGRSGGHGSLLRAVREKEKKGSRWNPTGMWLGTRKVECNGVTGDDGQRKVQRSAAGQTERYADGATAAKC